MEKRTLSEKELLLYQAVIELLEKELLMNIFRVKKK